MSEEQDEQMNEIIPTILMGPVRRYVAAWLIILCPWLLLWEQPAVEDTTFEVGDKIDSWTPQNTSPSRLSLRSGSSSAPAADSSLGLVGPHSVGGSATSAALQRNL